MHFSTQAATKIYRMPENFACQVINLRAGAGAFVGSGSVITDDVPEDALALGRGRQVVKAGWGKAFRDANKKN